MATLTERIRDCCQQVRAQQDGEWNAQVIFGAACVDIIVTLTRDGKSVNANRLTGHAEIDTATPETLERWFGGLVRGANTALAAAPTLQ